MHRLRPDAETGELDDDSLAELYGAYDRARPTLRVNFVTSVDGAVSLQGYSAGLSGPADKRVFGLLRRGCDALLVAAGTLRQEGYGALRLDPARSAWRTAHGLSPHPVLAVVSGRLALDPASPVFTEAPVRPVVITHRGSPPQARAALQEVADVVVCGDAEVDLTAALAALRERGLNQVLCEGGPHLLGALTAADLVDELCLTISPQLTGPGAGRITAGPPVPVPRRLKLRHVLRAGDDLLLRYVRS